MSTKINLFVLLALIAGSAWLAPTRQPATASAQVVAINPELLGMVVRDPWYEFGTNPRYPNQPNYEAQERMGQILAEAGVRWVRLEFFVDEALGGLEPNLARYDYFVNEVAPRHKLKVMGLLGFAVVRDVDPRDARYGLLAPTSSDPQFGGGVNPYLRTWLDRALQIAVRYGDRVAAYEVLNEQNRLPGAPGQFGGGEGIDPALAARLHAKFYRCFKQNQCAHSSPDPVWRAGVRLILGGLHPRGSDSLLGTAPAPARPGPVSDRDYLAALYSSEPFGSYFAANGTYPVDGLGYHPYPVEIRSTLQQIDAEVGRVGARLDELRSRLRATLQKTDPVSAEVPFWITEIGYNAGYGQQNSAGQASFMRAIFGAMAARGDVATVFWFKYEDFPPADGPDAQRWGIVRVPFELDARCPGGACYAPSGEPELRRAAFFVYRELAGLPNQYIFLPLTTR